jgi:uracil-DNA glycosylase
MCHLQVGKEKRVAVVLACPGKAEEQIGLPAVGPTGRNLNVLLDLLARRLRRPDLTRQNITVTNASSTVMYEAQDGDTEPSKADVQDPKNLCRVQEELREITDFVIFSGQAAKALMGSLQLPNRPKFVHVRHLGLQSLNQIKLQDAGANQTGRAEGVGEDNTRRRLEIVADEITEQLRLG